MSLYWEEKPWTHFTHCSGICPVPAVEDLPSQSNGIVVLVCVCAILLLCLTSGCCNDFSCSLAFLQSAVVRLLKRNAYRAVSNLTMIPRSQAKHAVRHTAYPDPHAHDGGSQPTRMKTSGTCCRQTLTGEHNVARPSRRGVLHFVPKRA